MVLSNDNGGMSGTYGLGCCVCGTSCGGLNYPYRGWKDSFWEAASVASASCTRASCRAPALCTSRCSESVIGTARY